MPDAAGVRLRPRRLVLLGTLAIAAAVVAVVAFQLRTREPDRGDAALDGAPRLGAGLGEVDPDRSGDQAPDFSIGLLGGDTFSLASHLADDGRPVFLNFWASWCIPCRQEMPAIDAAAARHPGVLFLGIAVQDDPVAAEEFAAEIGVDYPIGIDERETVSAAYPSFGLPVTYLISGDGVILTQLYGEVDGERIDAEISTWFGG